MASTLPASSTASPTRPTACPIPSTRGSWPGSAPALASTSALHFQVSRSNTGRDEAATPVSMTASPLSEWLATACAGQ